MPQQPQFQLRSVDPSEGPDWRWNVAIEMHTLQLRAGRSEDPLITDAVRYFRVATILDPLVAAQKWPDLYTAHSIYRNCGLQRDMLEAYLLTGESFDAISKKTGISSAVIAIFEKLFFNVSDALNAQGWLIHNVVKIVPGKPVTEGQVWKYLALACGASAVDLMVADFLGQPDPNPVQRSELAAKGRWVVREFATDWTSAAAVRSLLKDADKLFPSFKRNPQLQIHRDVIELALGSPDSHSIPKTVTRTDTISPRARKPRKVANHGRSQAQTIQVAAIA